MQVDLPASIRANFVPPVGQTFTTSMVWDSITVKNALLPSGSKIFVRTAGRNASVDATNLFPYLDGIGVYAGNCIYNDPSRYDTDYFVPSATRGYTALNPGDALRALNVEMPTLRVPVRRTNSTTNFAYAEVKVTPLDSGCSGSWTGSLSFTSSTTVRNFDVAVPFGKYRICVATRTNATDSSTSRTFTTTPTSTPPDQDLTTVPPTANRTVPTMTTGSTTGTCLP
jgi:hypothetical protein